MSLTKELCLLPFIVLITFNQNVASFEKCAEWRRNDVVQNEIDVEAVTGFDFETTQAVQSSLDGYCFLGLKQFGGAVLVA